MSDDTTHSVEIPVLDVFDRKSLDGLVQHITDSGALGRSKVYTQLLRYLVERTGDPNPPKEIEVAIDVLGRDSNFDVAKDSVVRVYIHQLRKKLDRYYSDYYPLKYNQDPGYRLVIPKGEYTVAATYFEPETPANGAIQTGTDRPPAAFKRRNNIRPWLIAATVLLALNLGILFVNNFSSQRTAHPLYDAAQAPIWRAVLSDDTPILLVVGDYYIFGELDEAGNVKRMVREFTINSPLDLQDLFMEQPDLAWRYYDLDLSYIPEGSAFALNSVSPILPYGGKSVEVKMMSELSTQDITTHHIIYVGYISGLDRLNDMVFAASGLNIGNNYDELLHKESGQSFKSNAGLPSFHEPFVDYGYLSLIRSTKQTYMLIIAGMRDAGLIHTAKALTKQEDLNGLAVALKETVNEANFDSYEALYEVRGLNRKNFSAEIVFTNFVDSSSIWSNNLLETSSANSP